MEGDIIRFVSDPSKATETFAKEVKYIEKLIGKKLDKGTTEIDFSKYKFSEEQLKNAAEGF